MVLARIFRRGMSCEDVLEVLQSYLDGEVDTEVARNVLAHLDACQLCDGELVIYRRIKQSLHLRRVEIDPDVRAGLSRFGQRVARGEIS